MALSATLQAHGWRHLEPADAPLLGEVEAALRSSGTWGPFGLDPVARRRDEPAWLLYELCSAVGTFLVVRHDPATGEVTVVFQGEEQHLIDDDTVCIV